MNQWIEYAIAGAGMIFASTGFWSLVQRQLDKHSDSRKMSLGITYLGIKMSCTTVLKKGWISTEELEDLEKYLYEPYKKMGGNGTAEVLINKVKALPNQPPEKKGDKA